MCELMREKNKFEGGKWHIAAIIHKKILYCLSM